jgi:DNA-binding transcriptional MerR regulator
MPDKLYIRIGEVAEQLEVESHVIRYWEKEFQINPHRSNAGQRMYRKHEVSLLKRIKTLVYEEGYTLTGAKKVMAGHVPIGEATELQLTEMYTRLQRLHERIESLRIENKRNPSN